MSFATRKCIKNIYKPSVDRRSFLVRLIVCTYQYFKTSISWLAIKISSGIYSWLDIDSNDAFVLPWHEINNLRRQNIHYLWHFQRAHNFPIGYSFYVALFTKKLQPAHLWTWSSLFFSYIRSCKGIFKYKFYSMCTLDTQFILHLFVIWFH